MKAGKHEKEPFFYDHMYFTRENKNIYVSGTPFCPKTTEKQFSFFSVSFNEKKYIRFGFFFVSFALRTSFSLSLLFRSLSAQVNTQQIF